MRLTELLAIGVATLLELFRVALALRFPFLLAGLALCHEGIETITHLVAVFLLHCFGRLRGSAGHAWR